jgi:ketosteroid isomerase-like protein
MTDTADIVRRYWALANARDWAGFGALLAPDVVYEVPQTRERVRGRDPYVEFNRTWPGAWHVEITELIAQPDRAVSVTAFHVDGQTMTGICFFECRDGLITRLTDWWPGNYDPPPRQTSVIERW